MSTQIIILILNFLEVIFITLAFMNYSFVRNRNKIIFTFIVSIIYVIIGCFGLLDLLIKINRFHYEIMFIPLIFYSTYQLLRIWYKKDTKREPVSTYATDYDFTDKRGLNFGDYMFNALLLIITIGLTGLLFWIIK